MTNEIVKNEIVRWAITSKELIATRKTPQKQWTVNDAVEAIHIALWEADRAYAERYQHGRKKHTAFARLQMILAAQQVQVYGRQHYPTIFANPNQEEELEKILSGLKRRSQRFDAANFVEYKLAAD